MPRTSLALLSLIALQLLASGGSPHVPHLLGEFNGYPEWVSTEVAVREGSLNAEVLRPSDIERLTEFARMNPAPAAGGTAECKAFTTWKTEHPQARATVDQLVDNSKYLVSGRIVAVQDGFLRGFAGRMLRVSGPLLKGPSSSDAYVFYPAATIPTSAGTICARPVGDYTQPQIGDRIIAFAIAGGRSFGDVTLLEADPTHEVVHESAKGKLRLPNALARVNGSLTFDEMDARVRGRLTAKREVRK